MYKNGERQKTDEEEYEELWDIVKSFNHTSTDREMLHFEFLYGHSYLDFLSAIDNARREICNERREEIHCEEGEKRGVKRKRE
jgi:hypothetical protein